MPLEGRDRARKSRCRSGWSPASDARDGRTRCHAGRLRSFQRAAPRSAPAVRSRSQPRSSVRRAMPPPRSGRCSNWKSSQAWNVASVPSCSSDRADQLRDPPCQFASKRGAFGFSGTGTDRAAERPAGLCSMRPASIGSLQWLQTAEEVVSPLQLPGFCQRSSLRIELAYSERRVSVEAASRMPNTMAVRRMW